MLAQIRKRQKFVAGLFCFAPCTRSPAAHRRRQPPRLVNDPDHETGIHASLEQTGELGIWRAESRVSIGESR